MRRGITHSALRHTLGFVLRIVVAIHARHRLPAVLSLPDHRAHISGNERLSWIEPSPEEHLPSSWSFSAPRAIQWPHSAIVRWVVTMSAMSLSVPHFIIGGGGITQGPPTPSLYWFSTTLLQGRTPTRSLPGSMSAFSIFPTRMSPPTLVMVAWSSLWSTDIRVGISVYGWIPNCLLVTGKRHSGLLCSELFPWWVSHLDIAMRTSQWLFSRWTYTRRRVGYFVGLNDTCYASHCACFVPHCLCHKQVPYDCLVTAVHQYLGPFSKICHTPRFIPAQSPR